MAQRFPTKFSPSLNLHSFNNRETLRTSAAIKLAALAFGCALSAGALAQAKTDGPWRGVGGAALAVTSGNTSTNSKPPTGVKKNDVGLFTGVNVKFGAL